MTNSFVGVMKSDPCAVIHQTKVSIDTKVWWTPGLWASILHSQGPNADSFTAAVSLVWRGVTAALRNVYDDLQLSECCAQERWLGLQMKSGWSAAFDRPEAGHRMALVTAGLADPTG